MRAWCRFLTTLVSVGALQLFGAGISSGYDSQALQYAGGRGFFMGGTNIIDIGELNTRLKNNGYHTFSDNLIGFGGGGYGILNRLIIGGEGFGMSSAAELGTAGGETFKTTLSGGYGLFKLGYVVYRRGGFNLYPAVGFGGGGLALEITRKETVAFDDILKSPKRNVQLSNGCLLIDIGVGVDYLMILDRKNTGDEGGLAFGMRVGYLAAPYRSDWGDALDGPDIGFDGFYFRLMFGGGGGKNK